ncbi:hypothetical protein AB0G35_29830 [Streptomyces sp. NPDC021749]|uniref:hypothetical protein n=2 Tax=unclassified Streptomyces TaxID=2593676 RepID=UPI0033F083A9
MHPEPNNAHRHEQQASAIPHVTHATPMTRDLIYDHRAQQAALPVQLHHSDSSAESESVLILTPSEMELYAIQIERAIKIREDYRAGLRSLPRDDL